jgi:hypothetical protein
VEIADKAAAHSLVHGHVASNVLRSGVTRINHVSQQYVFSLFTYLFIRSLFYDAFSAAKTI